MNWIVVSLVLFVSSVALYLSVRKAQLQNVPGPVQNLAMFGIPAAIFFVFVLLTGRSLAITLPELQIITATAFFLSYLGNVFSLEGIRLAPNPGYSLMISKSYVVFTAVVAFFLFRSELTPRSVAAIALIILGSVLISLPSRTAAAAAKNPLWIIYSLGAFFCWGGLSLVSKYVLSNGLDVFVYLFYLSALVALFILLEIIIRPTGPRSYALPVPTLLLIGLFSVVFNLGLQYGIKIAPNPGYINAVNASSISLLTLLSVYFFKDDFSLRKFIGIVSATLGLIILFI